MLAWLSVWSKVQTCIWRSLCHCHSLSLASVKSRLVLPFCYQLTWVVLEKGLLNGCVSKKPAIGQWVGTCCTLSMSFKNSFTVRLSSKLVVKLSFPYFIRNQIFCKEQSSFISYSYVLSDSRDWMTAILISFIDVCLQCFDTVGWASGTPSSW